MAVLSIALYTSHLHLSRTIRISFPSSTPLALLSWTSSFLLLHFIVLPSVHPLHCIASFSSCIHTDMYIHTFWHCHARCAALPSKGTPVGSYCRNTYY
ncbi:hypothetical protein BJ912DRAFT_332260 [Pholiota molesta]|nr:hypothetical protein BJ912DRAFT_332260 [Pholiota molesta]